MPKKQWTDDPWTVQGRDTKPHLPAPEKLKIRT